MKEQNSTLRYFIVKVLVCACILGYASFCFAQEAGVSYEDLRQKYLPQDSPEATYRLELEMMSEGMYCYDLPIFDNTWRSKGKQVSYSPSYKNIDKWQNSHFTSYIQGDYAVIYYPQNLSAGPVFAYRGDTGWILDRTTVMNYIHYSTDNSRWFAYEGDYPYLTLLKSVFSLKKVTLRDSTQAYMIE